MTMLQLKAPRRLAFPPRSRRAATLFGVILGIGVSAIVVAGLVTAYNGVITSVRAGNVQSAVIAAATNVRRTMANATTFVGSTASLNAIIFSSAPSNMQNVGGASAGSGPTRGITFPWWDGAATFAGATTGLTADRFAFQLTDIPSAVCEAVASSFVGDPSVTRVAGLAGSTAITATTGTVMSADGTNVSVICIGDELDLFLQFTG